MNYKNLFFALSVLVAVQANQINTVKSFGPRSPEATAWAELHDQIQELIAGQVVSENIMNDLVTFDSDNKFYPGEMVAVKRKSGDLAGKYTYGFIKHPDLETPNPRLPLINLGQGFQKNQYAQDVGKFINKPSFSDFIRLPGTKIYKKSSEIKLTEKQQTAIYELYEQIKNVIGAKNVSHTILKYLVDYDPDNIFAIGELVVIKRSDGSFNYGFVAYPREDKYIVEFGNNQKALPPSLVGKLEDIEPKIEDFIHE